MKKALIIIIVCVAFQARAQIELGFNLSGISWPQNEIYSKTHSSGIYFSPLGIGAGLQGNVILNPNMRLGFGMEYISASALTSHIVENISGFNYLESIQTRNSGVFLRADFQYAFINDFKGTEDFVFYGIGGAAINFYNYADNNVQTPTDTNGGGGMISQL